MPLDVDESKRTRKLLDACMVLLEGGGDEELEALSDLDYVLEEKKEAVELERLRLETERRLKKEEEAAMAEEGEMDEEAAEEAKLRRKLKADLDKEERGEGGDEKVHTVDELEIMQHAKDYSLYVKVRFFYLFVGNAVLHFAVLQYAFCSSAICIFSFCSFVICIFCILPFAICLFCNMHFSICIF